MSLARIPKFCYAERMKRKHHPRRRHGRRHLSALSRHEWACEGVFFSKRRAREIGFAVATAQPRSETPFPAFPRAARASRNRTTLPRLIRAGYPFASLESVQDWTDVHAWLEARCTHKFGRAYTWFGGTFVFETRADCNAFRSRFPCSEDYKPMFAFETSRQHSL